MASVPSGTRVEATVLRMLGPQGSLFELFLPAGMRVLSGELAEIDAVLDDPRFFAPFIPFFSRTDGRPSIPIETYLRLMFLKTRHGLGYERLVVQVTDSLSLRRFCRIGLETPVPNESTIRKLTARLGPDLVDELNRLLLTAANERTPLAIDRVRVDTTVVEANIKYPTDSGLLTKAISRIAVQLTRVNTAGLPVVFVDRTTQARAFQHSIGAWLRRRSDEAKTEVLAITGLLADLAELSVTEAMKALHGKGRRRRPVRRLLDKLAVLIERTVQVIEQARSRAGGTQPPGATRLVSLHEPDARPISKGQLGKGTQFGFKAQVADNADGIILDYSVHIGNPSDTGLLRPAIERITTLTGVPGLVTADRGYWDANIEHDLTTTGVTTVVIPRTGKASKARATIEQATEFVTAVKWRTGSEGRISHLKRDCGWRRTHLRRHDGARIWCAHGVFAHNLVKLTRLQR